MPITWRNVGLPKFDNSALAIASQNVSNAGRAFGRAGNRMLDLAREGKLDLTKSAVGTALGQVDPNDPASYLRAADPRQLAQLGQSGGDPTAVLTALTEAREPALDEAIRRDTAAGYQTLGGIDDSNPDAFLREASKAPYARYADTESLFGNATDRFDALSDRQVDQSTIGRNRAITNKEEAERQEEEAKRQRALQLGRFNLQTRQAAKESALERARSGPNASWENDADPNIRAAFAQEVDRIADEEYMSSVLNNVIRDYAYNEIGMPPDEYALTQPHTLQAEYYRGKNAAREQKDARELAAIESASDRASQAAMGINDDLIGYTVDESGNLIPDYLGENDKGNKLTSAEAATKHFRSFETVDENGRRTGRRINTKGIEDDKEIQKQFERMTSYFPQESIQRMILSRSVNDRGEISPYLLSNTINDLESGLQRWGTANMTSAQLAAVAQRRVEEADRRTMEAQRRRERQQSEAEALARVAAMEERADEFADAELQRAQAEAAAAAETLAVANPNTSADTSPAVDPEDVDYEFIKNYLIDSGQSQGTFAVLQAQRMAAKIERIRKALSEGYERIGRRKRNKAKLTPRRRAELKAELNALLAEVGVTQ